MINNLNIIYSHTTPQKVMFSFVAFSYSKLKTISWKKIVARESKRNTQTRYICRITFLVGPNTERERDT